jgi:hypothetical protein
MSQGAQNLKMGPDALGANEERVRKRKTYKRDPTPSVPPKTGPGAENMKKGPDTLNTAENESGSAKHENGTRRGRY